MMKEIDKALNMDPIEGEIVSKVPKKVDVPTENYENDHKYARENFYNVIEKGTDALEQMLDVARASEHPRAYEVVSTLMKTLVDANKDLVELSKKKQEQEQNENGESSQNVTNNNIFVGSTHELQQMIKDMREDNE